MDKCQWKLIGSDEFVMGISADRCGATAAVKILRPNRKTDLFLCERHINAFIARWNLHNQIEILCQDETEQNISICTDNNCKKCLQDDPRTWNHGGGGSN